MKSTIARGWPELSQLTIQLSGTFDAPMMLFANDRRTNLALSLLLGLALLLSAFAHRPMAAAAGLDAAAYALPDGSLQSFCLPGDGETKNGSASGCEFCRLAGTMLVPEPPMVLQERLGVHAGTLQDGCFNDLTQIALPAAPVRGPPLFA